ncbi:MAG TPA: hypothetical protein VMF11_11295 [Candidatus Baltobacteraceae bacterium]|nr:hypothetical protein [Candidatus Baltobacteraceae bacterium]
MGTGGSITLVNGTTHDWRRTHQNSYQMAAWEFPQAIAAGTAPRIYVEWDERLLHEWRDDVGEVTYAIGDTGHTFQVQASVRDGKYDVRIYFENLATQGTPRGATLDLGWGYNGDVTFVLASAGDDFISNTVPTSWMQNNLAILGDLTLRRLCMPGSHDAGMSVLNAHTFFGTAANCCTQTHSIRNQLELGVRYFDIRPVISGGQYFTGHYGYVKLLNSWQGANGESMAQVLSAVRDYTAKHKELVVLHLSHEFNTDVANDRYRVFTQEEWDRLLALVRDELEAVLFIAKPADVDLTTLKLKDFIGTGKAAVVVRVDPGDGKVGLGRFAGQGFYPQCQYPIFDQYSNTDNIGQMATDQLSKMKANKPDGKAACFLLAWTLTQTAAEAAAGFPPILMLGLLVNPRLYGYLYPACTPDCFPNILNLDCVSTSTVTALAMALNARAARSAGLPSGSVASTA